MGGFTIKDLLVEYAKEISNLPDNKKIFLLNKKGKEIIAAFSEKYGDADAEVKFLLLNDAAFAGLVRFPHYIRTVYHFLYFNFDNSIFKNTSSPWTPLTEFITFSSNYGRERVEQLLSFGKKLLIESPKIRLNVMKYLLVLFSCNYECLLSQIDMIYQFVLKEDMVDPNRELVTGLVLDFRDLLDLIKK